MQIQSYTSTLTNRNKFKQHNNRYAYTAPVLKKDEVSFGLNPMNMLTDGIAHGIGKLGSTKPVQKLVDFLKDGNYQQHLAAFVGVVLASFYMLDTAKSKKIEKDQKMPLIINQAVVCGLSTAGAYTLDNYLDKKIGEFTEKFNIANITDDKTRKMFIKLKDNPEYHNVIARKLESSQDAQKALEILKKQFKVNIDTLNEALKISPNDNSIKKVINKITSLTNAQLIETTPEKIFLEEMQNSQSLTEIFKAQSIVNAKNMDLDTITDPKVKKLISKIRIVPEKLESIIKIEDIRKAFPVFSNLGEDAPALNKMFEFNNSIEKKLRDLIKKGQADEVVQKVYTTIKQLPKKIVGADNKIIDRADKAKEIFVNEMKNSKILTEIFKKQSLTNALKLVSNNDTSLSTLMNGFKIAKSLMVFTMIYRFISPVFATPVANWISEKLEFTKKKEA